MQRGVSLKCTLTLICRSLESSLGTTSEIGSTPWSASRTALPPPSTSRPIPAGPRTRSRLPRRRMVVLRHTLVSAHTPTTPRLDSTVTTFPEISSVTIQTQVRLGILFRTTAHSGMTTQHRRSPSRVVRVRVRMR